MNPELNDFYQLISTGRGACKGHLSICRGVGERSVSDNSQVKPFTHITISSSEVAVAHREQESD